MRGHFLVWNNDHEQTVPILPIPMCHHPNGPRMRIALTVLSTLLFLASSANAAQPAVRDIEYRSGADDTMQRAMFYAPKSDKRVPLMVALHTWSGDYTQDLHKEIETWCLANGWAYIHPNFRGPNKRPEATGSDLVIEDIASAVAYAKREANIDAGAVYLVGTSGGGYTSLLMAARRPKLWAGVSAWVPISDLAAWYEQDQYRKDLVKSCGGKPGDSVAVDEEYRKRSPLTYLADAKGVNLHINAGITDGHTGSVPVSHSLLAFNRVADRRDHVAAEDIRYLVEKIAVPKHLKREIDDASYGKKRPLFRRTSGKTTVTVFDGGHELVAPAAVAWFLKLEAERKK